MKELVEPNFVRCIRKLDMREASKMVSVLNRYGFGTRLVSNNMETGELFCVDACSILGTIAATYNDCAELRVYDVPDNKVKELNESLVEFYK